MTNEADRIPAEADWALLRPGCGPGFSAVLIIAFIVTRVVGGPQWLAITLVVLTSMSIGGGLGFLVSLYAIGMLVHATWGTWWLLLPVALLIIRPHRVITTRAAAPFDHARLWRHARKLHTQAIRSKRLDKVKASVSVFRQVVAVTPLTHPDRPKYLITLCDALILLANSVDDVELVEEAVRVGRDAIRLTAPDDPSRTTYLAVLARALTILYTRNRDEEVLEEAVRWVREVLSSAPGDDGSKVGELPDLAFPLYLWFELTGDWTIQKELVRITRAVLAATDREDPMRIERMANLVAALATEDSRSANTAALEEAIAVGREAVASADVRADRPLRAMCFANLSTALQMLGRRTGDVAVLREAVEFSRRAVDATLDDDPGLGRRLAALSAALQRLGERDDDEQVWEEAARVGRRALAILPGNSTERSLVSVPLVNALLHLGLAEEAHEVLGRSVAIVGQPAARRIAALRMAADLELRAGDLRQAKAKVELAVTLIPRVASPRLDWANRGDQASALTGLATTAAAVFVAAGEPNRAVELLEQTRGIVLADLLDTRGSLTAVRATDAKLARKFAAVGKAIERAEDPDERAELNRRWTELLARIRELPGHADFLLTPLIAQLRGEAREGPIVYVTAHRESGHGLILVDDPDQPVRVVKLPEFTHETAAEQADLLRDARRTASASNRTAAERVAAQEKMLRVLGWLWDAVTEPILAELGHDATPPAGEPWPRVWWCPVGITASLPLHAAGQHTRRSGDTVLDRVVSSYTPTIRALGHARASGRASRSPSMLIVAVPDAPDSPPLVGVTREAELLQELFPNAVRLPHPTHDDVAEALGRHRIAHLACHGVADLSAPAESRLLLHDHLDRPLSVATIARLRLEHCELAYLSACSTTDTTRWHADEATHITTAFQLAGYRSVIGTLWPINDHAATVVAADFYTRLAGDTDVAATALHHTIRRHRDRYPRLPTQWAAYLHTGT
ncbi:CHAT domain-containing protein [Allokutzneria sp. A3M-2-11 16]|uniref:CHAT domain-containing protein n=1 Tax=Allokutzneria sp. A3M-2-11 16 TaxID=2962043 RepID=UPI0020B658C9|nr:CHAT domain-containing protein [Allokutzneria sp. A3M-2-11 16]MCP3803506.1 CHAT domain-containing protein [Allokutzneria sp. A3M-2-11 16]